ncbi:MAG TPA: EF-hand domain-containing protein [Ramlibacter sp.]|nr:EF-hand domain-containing protein [Ramlibacter sp.]
MKRGRHLAASTVLAVAAAVTHAQTPAPAPQPPPPNRWTVAQIREAFQLADANGDGQLSRAEAQRLPLLPRSFEDTDLNKDGVLTLDEYQASFSRS